MTVTSSKAIAKEIRRRQKAIADAKPLELDADFEAQNNFVNDSSRFLIAQCSRRAGKCRPKGTKVKTPTGYKNIENLRPGDAVYGYDKDGVVRPAKVLKLYDQGIKEVVSMTRHGIVVAESTINHRWLAHNTFNGKKTVKTLESFNSRDKVTTSYLAIPGGTKSVKQAYTLGALLGDGCSRDGGLHISGTDPEIFNTISEELGLQWKKIHPSFHTHSFIGAEKHSIPFYDQWCHNKYAHEKTCSLEEIRTWTRESQLRFLAGLIDTDGSVRLTSDGRLDIRIGMQAIAVIDVVEALLLDLFQVQATRSVDSRAKYKNGPIHQLRINSNLFSKRILKELPIKCTRKQWKPEYSNLVEKNTKEDYVGIKILGSRLEHCYDIEIDNDSHLFLDANGMIGHNSNALALKFIRTMEKYPGSQCLYLALTRDSARAIMWTVLQEHNDKYKLGCTFLESRLTMTHPNGAKLRLLGADSKNLKARFKGIKCPGVAIDEAQDFGSHLQALIDEALSPTIADYADGWLALTGTPGPVPQGYFFDATQNAKYGYSVHRWTVLDNPYMPDAASFIDGIKTRFQWDDNNPTLLREWKNRWVLDAKSLWINYNEKLNHYTQLPTLSANVKYNYILGVDIGFKDADALAVLAWSETLAEVYLVEELITSKQDITSLANQIESLRKKYNISKIVMDAGALGKKVAEEIIRRHQIPVEAADKQRKQENVEFLNDFLRLGKFKAKSASRFAQDSYLIQIDWDKSTPDKIVIKKNPHSDIIDAVLYAFKVSPAYTYVKPKPVPSYGSSQWAKDEADRMFEEAQDFFEKQAEEKNAFFGEDT